MLTHPCIALFLIFPSIYAQQNCGQTPIAPNLNKDPKIFGGQEAVPYSWPWQVVLCLGQGPDGDFGGCTIIGGGTIVGNKWIMTAATTVDWYQNSPKQFRVKAGVYDQRSDDEPGEQMVHVKQITQHPLYRPNPYYMWDIALMELSSPLVYTNQTQPVCLPIDDTEFNVPGNTGWATGWGIQEDSSITYRLKQIHIAVENTSTCQDDYGFSYYPGVMMCAGHTEHGPCNSDTGGPLVAQKDGKWTQYGIISRGQGCAALYHAGVYSRVSAFCDWISQTTSQELQCQ